MVRFLANGTLDPSFATGGTLIFDNPGSISDEVLVVALQPDNRIDVMGSAEATRRAGSCLSWRWPSSSPTGALMPRSGLAEC